MKLFVLVKAYELVVDGVEVHVTADEALAAFRRWIDGLTPEELTRREERNPEEKFSQSKIFEVEFKEGTRKHGKPSSP
jgi:hypothetical protein